MSGCILPVVHAPKPLALSSATRLDIHTDSVLYDGLDIFSPMDLVSVINILEVYKVYAAF